MVPCFLRKTTPVFTLILFLLCVLPGFNVPLQAQNMGEWYAQSTTGTTPERRHESAFVELDGRFYLIGGRGSRRIQVYNPLTKDWSDTKTLTDDLHHFQARAHGGKIYLLGALTGRYPNEKPLEKVLIYDPRSDQLTRGTTIPQARRRGSSGIALYNGVFYLIAGNRNGHSAFLDDGTTPANVAWADKYDPATGAWTVLPDAPHARDHFFAEVIDDKVYVAGGRRSKAGTPAGTWSDTETAVDVFDLASERWLSGTDLPDRLPTARAGAATAVVNHELLVMGGEVADNPPADLALPHTEVLNPATGKWRRVADLALPRHGTQAVVYEEDVYLAGGSKTKGGTEINPGKNFLETFSFIDAPGATYSDWTTIGNSPVARCEGPVIVYRGEYYLLNGFEKDLIVSKAVEKYNPATRTWTSLARMPSLNGAPTEVTHNGATLVGDVIWVVGGRLGDHPGPVTNAVWLYDIPNNKWSQGPSLPLRRGGGGLVRLGNSVHYVGGFDENARCDVDTHLKFDLEDPASGWQDLTASSPLPLPRNHFGAVTLGGKLYVVGGQNGHDGCGNGADLAFLHAYDPLTDEWERLADLPEVQSHAEPGTFVHNGKILMVGGEYRRGRGVWEYDPVADAWKILDEMTLPVTLLAPVARVHQGRLFVVNGGHPSTHMPTSVIRVKDFVPITNPALTFNPTSLTRSLAAGEKASVQIILSNLNGEEVTPYQLPFDDFPNWLTVDRPAGSVRESDTELTLTLDASGLTNGNHTYTILASATGYRSAKLVITLTVTGGSPTPSSHGQFLEAECAAVGTNWWIRADGEASAGRYVEAKFGQPTAGNQPPADLAANRITFTTDVPQPGLYHLYARVKAPSGRSDSFWVRINGGRWLKWWEGVQTGAAFDWREVLQDPYALPAGRITIDVAYREAGTLLDKLYLTTTPEAPQGRGGPASNCDGTPPFDPMPNASQWLEAECTQSGRGWVRKSGSTTSNNGYVDYPGKENLPMPAAFGGDAQLQYTAELTEAGLYTLYFRMNAPSVSKNSFWVSVDDGKWLEFWQDAGKSELLTNGFAWKEVLDDGLRVPLELEAGTHTIRVAPRETGTQLDKVYLGESTTVPTGVGEVARNCGGGMQQPSITGLPTPSARASQETGGNVALGIYPNPVSERLQFTLRGAPQGELRVQLIDMMGRVIRTLRYQYQGNDELRSTIEVDDLAGGSYFLRIVNVRIGHLASRAFVKAPGGPQ